MSPPGPLPLSDVSTVGVCIPSGRLLSPVGLHLPLPLYHLLLAHPKTTNQLPQEGLAVFERAGCRCLFPVGPHLAYDFKRLLQFCAMTLPSQPRIPGLVLDAAYHLGSRERSVTN